MLSAGWVAWSLDADAELPPTAQGARLRADLQAKIGSLMLTQADARSCGRAAMHNLLCMVAPEVVERWAALRSHPSTNVDIRSQFAMLSIVAAHLVGLGGFAELPFFSRLLAGDEAATQLLSDFASDTVPLLSNNVFDTPRPRGVARIDATPKPKPKPKPGNTPAKLQAARRVQVQLRRESANVPNRGQFVDCAGAVWTRTGDQRQRWFLQLRAQSGARVFDVELPTLYA